MGNSLLGNSAVPQYVKLTATGILGATYLSALIIATHDMLAFGPNAPVPSVVAFILGTGLSLALGVLGLHQGASLAEAMPALPTQSTSTTSTTSTTQTGTGGDANASAPTA